MASICFICAGSHDAADCPRHLTREDKIALLRAPIDVHVIGGRSWGGMTPNRRWQEDFAGGRRRFPSPLYDFDGSDNR